MLFFPPSRLLWLPALAKKCTRTASSCSFFPREFFPAYVLLPPELLPSRVQVTLELPRAERNPLSPFLAVHASVLALPFLYPSPSFPRGRLLHPEISWRKEGEWTISLEGREGGVGLAMVSSRKGEESSSLLPGVGSLDRRSSSFSPFLAPLPPLLGSDRAPVDPRILLRSIRRWL